MKNKLKKIISVFMVVVILFISAPIYDIADTILPNLSKGGLLDSMGSLLGTKASAADNIVFGNCGIGDVQSSGFAEDRGKGYSDNLQWSLNIETGELNIYGQGDMGDFYALEVYQPWGNHKESHYWDIIKKVVISEGVTSIGKAAFCFCSNIESIYIPSTIKTYGIYCFHEIPRSAKIYYSGDKGSYTGPSFSNIIYNYNKNYLPGNIHNILKYAKVNSQNQKCALLDFNTLSPVEYTELSYENRGLNAIADGYYSIDIDNCALNQSDIMLFGAVPTSTDSHISAVHCDGYDALIESSYVAFPVTGLSSDDDKYINITVYSDLSDVETFQLLQNGSVLAESSNGNFNIKVSTIPIEKKISVRVIDSNGKKYSTLTTNIKTYNSKGFVTAEKNKISIKLPSDIILIGGTKIDIDLSQLPVFFICSDDSVFIGIGASGKSEYSKLNGKTTTVKKPTGAYSMTVNETENATVYEGKYTSPIQAWKRVVDDAVYDWNNLKTYMRDCKNIADKFYSAGLVSVGEGGFVSNMSGTSSICGYVELKKNSNGKFSIIASKGCFAASLSYSNEWQYAAWNIPLVFSVDVSVGFSTELNIGFDLDKKEILFNSDLDITIPSVKGAGGPGIAKVANLKGFIEVENKINLSFSKKYITGSLTGDIGVSGKIFCFTGEKKLLNFLDWQYLYEKWGEDEGITDKKNKIINKKNNQLYDYSSLLSDDSYTLDTRDYLNNQSDWLGDSLMSTNNQSRYNKKVLQTSIYDSSKPMVVSTKDGTSILIWTADISTRSSGNQNAIVYSVYNKNINTWSAPEIISDDGSFDEYAKIATDGEDIYVVYSSANKIFTADNVSIENLASSFEIEVAHFNKDTNNFEKTVTITSDDNFNYLTDITVVDGTAYVAFAENSNNDPLYQSGVNSIYMAQISADGTYTINKMADCCGALTDCAIGLINNEISIAYAMDCDEDLQSTKDIELYKVDMKKNVTQITTNDLYEQNIKFSKINGDVVFSYYCNNNIYYTYNFENYESLVESIDVPLTCDYQFLDDSSGSILFVVANSINDEYSNIYASIYTNNKWSKLVKVTDEDANIQYYSAYKDANNNIGLVFSTISYDTVLTDQIEQGYCKGTFGETVNLYSTSFNRYTDIALNSIKYSDDDVKNSKELPVTIDISNNGLSNVNLINLSIKKDGEEYYSENIDVSIASGYSEELMIKMPLPDEITDISEYNFTVYANDDIDMSNNTLQEKIGYADLAIIADKYYAGGNTSCVLSVMNSSTIKTDAKIVFHKNSLDGDIVGIYSLYDVAPNSVNSYYFTAQELNRMFVEGDTVCVEIISDKTEKRIGDNSTIFSMNKSDVKEFEYAILENNKIKITKYNGNNTDVKIPEKYDDYIVFSIGDNVFNDAVQVITLGGGIEEISSRAFNNAISLKEIRVMADNKKYISKSGILYSYDEAKLIKYPIGKNNNDFIIPDTVTSINSYSFYGSNLESVTIPETVTSIKLNAFSNCSNLKTIFYNAKNCSILSILNTCSFPSCVENFVVGANVDSLPAYLLKEAAVKEIIIPRNVTSINNQAFYNCNGLTIKAFANSCAKEYAEINGYVFVPITCGNCVCDEWEIISDSTCTSLGEKTGICSVCGASVTNEVPMKEHIYSDWIIIKSADCSSDGLKTRYCTVCGEKGYVTEIPATGHKEAEAVTENLINVTCTENGSYDSVVYCSDCGKELSRESITVPANGHSFKDGVCENCGVKDPSYINPDCNHFCHSSNKLVKMIYRIFRFFWKLFGIKQYCSCGAAHY